MGGVFNPATLFPVPGRLLAHPAGPVTPNAAPAPATVFRKSLRPTPVMVVSNPVMKGFSALAKNLGRRSPIVTHYFLK
jgi:hypothetical protein